MNTTPLANTLTDVVNGHLGAFLAKPFEAVDATTKVGALKTGEVVNTYLRFGVEVNPDDRTVKYVGKGLPPADPARATLFVLRRFSDPDARLDGVAMRQSSEGDLSVQLVHCVSAEGEFAVPVDVLGQFLERGVVSTAYLGALGLFTNLCDGGLDQDLARRLAREAFELYAPLFEQYGVADFFEPGSGADDDNDDN